MNLKERYRMLFRMQWIRLLLEREMQRKGRDKTTAVNAKYINSGKYRNKFDYISSNNRLNKILYYLSKQMLFHRSGTKFEDMYWIDLDTIRVIAKETNCKIEHGIIYSRKTKNKIKEVRDIITIHSHPDSFPPSIRDFNANYEYGYRLGVVVCHDGSVYLYSSNEYVNENYYSLVVEDYLKKGYNEYEVQLVALSEIQDRFDVSFKEVVDDGSIRK